MNRNRSPCHISFISKDDVDKTGDKFSLQSSSLSTLWTRLIWTWAISILFESAHRPAVRFSESDSKFRIWFMSCLSPHFFPTTYEQDWKKTLHECWVTTYVRLYVVQSRRQSSSLAVVLAIHQLAVGQAGLCFEVSICRPKSFPGPTR